MLKTAAPRLPFPALLALTLYKKSLGAVSHALLACSLFKKSLGAVSHALLACSLLAGCGEDRKPIPGEIPSLTLDTFSGEPFTLAAEKKAVILLVFWASWCGPCLMEIPALVQLHEKYRTQAFQVVSINVDDPSALPKAKAVAAKYGINYPTLIGSDETMKLFGGVQALPTSFLIGKDGRIKEKLMGLRSEAELERKILALLGNRE